MSTALFARNKSIYKYTFGNEFAHIKNDFSCELLLPVVRAHKMQGNVCFRKKKIPETEWFDSPILEMHFSEKS